MNYSCINFKTNVGNYNYEDASHPHAVSDVENMENKYYYLDKGVMVIRENNAFKSYLTFTDNLGSILAVMDKKGEKVFEASYDAWGKQTIKLNKIGLQRGYTGHEMLNDFDIINMNGRLYDSVLGRFLSPDNLAQMPDNAQRYNRYSYCLNNPLKYTDPSGELWNIVIGAAIGGLFNWASHDFQFNAKGLGYFVTGAVAGGISAGVASGVNVAMAGGNFWQGAAGLLPNVSSTGFIAGAATAASSGFAGGFITATSNTWIEGYGLGGGLLKGLSSGVSDALMGGITGGLIGGLDALDKGTNFWTGQAELELKGACYCSECMPNGFEIGESTITGKYVGQYEGVNVFESQLLGSVIPGHATHYGAVTIPERGIITGEGVFTSGLRDGAAMIQHEFGHILQYRMIGSYAYWHVIAPESLVNATFFPKTHGKFWTETWANYLSKNYFGTKWLGGTEYIAQEISKFNWFRIKLVQIQGLLRYFPRGMF